MRKNVWLVLGLGFALASGRAALADVWDVQTQNDNAVATTENELVHGSDQLHDLGALPGPAADNDWYRLSQKPFSSYEIVADATSGDIGTDAGRAPYRRGRRSACRPSQRGGRRLQPQPALGEHHQRGRGHAAHRGDERFVHDGMRRGRRLSSACLRDDYAVPRFNNSGTQVTVLLLQNPTNYTITGTVYFWSAAGAPVGTSPFNAGPEGSAGSQHLDRRGGHAAVR